MPVPASPAIASDVGHGALGLRDALRPLSELLEASTGQRHVWVEARPGKLLTGWMAHNATGTWAVPIAETFDGVRRDVVGVRCGTEALTRVQTLAACEATEGSFFYDPETPGQAARWDDGVTAWDSSTKWDQDPILYVHRLGGRPPTEVDVLAQLGIFWGSHGVWQPSMSATLLTDGGLEVWTSPTDLTYWAEYVVGAGGGTVNRDATDRAVGTYSARIDGSLNSAGGKGIYQVAITAVGGATYRFSGYYRTAEDNPADFEAMLNLGLAGYYLNVDGRTTNAPGSGFALARTNGYWRRFTFDFVCPADTTGFEVLAYAWNAAGGAQSGSVWFDDLALQRIHRFEFYEPRLTAEGVPSVDQGRPNGSAWWEPMQTALGQVSVTNANGLLEQLFAAYDWIGAEVILRVGGRFPDGGNEILTDDHFTAFIGKADAPRISDLSASLSLTDARVAFQQSVPRHRYDDGSPKPIVFGLGIGNQTIALQFSPPTYLLQQGIVPRLVGVGANGYGVYEVVDPSDSPYGLATFGGVSGTFFSYLDGEAAGNGAGWSHYGLSLTPLDGGGPEYAFDIVTGRLTILRDVQVVQITSKNNYVDFDIGGGALAAMLVPDTIFGQVSQKGTLRYIATLWLAQAMTAVAGAAIFITYDETTHKYTVSKAAGTLNLLCKTGANASISMWPLLGFDCSTDKTGSLSYTAENPVYRSTEQHIIRARITGYADDAAGTFTGTAGPAGIVEQPADCLHFILRVLAGVSADRINAASFVTARAAGPTYSGVFVREEMSIAELISWYEATIGADLRLDGGVYYLRVRDSSVPSDVLALQDRDYLSFEARYDLQDYGPKVRLLYNFNAESGGRWALEEPVAAAAARYEGCEPIEIPTALFSGTSPYQARARLLAIAAEAGVKRRRFAVTVTGRALILPVGAKVTLTRTKGLSMTGALSAVLCRIVAKRDSWTSWTSELELIEVV